MRVKKQYLELYIEQQTGSKFAKMYIKAVYWTLLTVVQLVKNLPAIWRPLFNFWVGKIHWRRDRPLTPVFLGFLSGSVGKEFTSNAGDLGLIPGLGRFPEEGNSYLLQCSDLENSMHCLVYGVTKSHT